MLTDRSDDRARPTLSALVELQTGGSKQSNRHEEMRARAGRNWLRRIARDSKRCGREFLAWWRYEEVSFPTVSQLAESIAALSACASVAVKAETDVEAPIFLLSSGMRTGSTLLQRILVTDRRLLLWGEPMEEMGVPSRIAAMLSDSLSPAILRVWKEQPSPTSSGLSKSWIAHLDPSPDDFRLALRSMFDRWLGQPARQHGFSRWGFKAVRLSATDASLLHWLYPNAKFVLLTRHPYECYRSFADAGWEDSFLRYPDLRINSAASFASCWNRIATSWSELPVGFPAIRIKYEELLSGTFDFRKFESWLGLQLQENEALSASVGATATRASLRWYERFIVEREARPGMRALGYRR